ncbi:MAG: DUF2809 domain-containing protein [Anaerolineae bacterium]|nr:DUF2809 domain-containing protein [Gloeobacterales cyanobacterium ES-bin-313]
MFAFNKTYFYFALLLFLIEVGIAVFTNDNFIRPFVGDVLVVILIYCFVRAFWNVPPLIVASAVLALAYTAEILQYFNFLSKLGMQNNKAFTLALGSVFDWKDIFAYTIGIISVICLENIKTKNKS